MTVVDTERASAWTRYWAQGHRHSCASAFRGHYGQATQSFWRDRLAAIDAESQVLELGCGNGSLVRFVEEAGAVWPAQYHALDAAAVPRDWLARLAPDFRARVRILDATPADRIPLPDLSVRHVFSQFGLEYFASEAVWAELSRVMQARSTLALVLHRRDSRLWRVASAEQGHCDWLLSEDGPLDRAAEVLPFMAAAAEARGGLRGEPQADLARRRFNEVFAALAERVQSMPFPDVLDDVARRVTGLLRSAGVQGLASARMALSRVRAEVLDNRLRVSELVACALGREDLEAWSRRLHHMGFTAVVAGEVEERGYPLGWTLAAQRGEAA